jgi:hypothetical protein
MKKQLQLFNVSPNNEVDEPKEDEISLAYSSIETRADVDQKESV